MRRSYHRPRRAALAAIAPLFAIIFAAALVALGATGQAAHATGAAGMSSAAGCTGPTAGQHIYDCGGRLTADEIATLETHAAAVVQAGAPVVVYIQTQDASYDETYAAAGHLMEDWDVESAPGAKDGLVLYINLEPGAELHGEVALYAGEKHFQGGNLTQEELQHDYDDVMLPILKDGDLAGAISAGLDEATRALLHGPYVDQTRQNAGIFGRDVYLPLAGLFMLAGGALLFFLWPRTPTGAASSGSTITRPDDLIPAEAGALVRGQVSDTLMEATILDFARRKLLDVQSAAHGQARIVLTATNPRLSGIELALWHALQGVSNDKRVIRPAKLRTLRQDWQPVLDELRQNLQQQGLFDPQAPQRRSWLLLPGVAALLVSLVGIIVAIVAKEGWPLLGTLALVAGGFVLLVAGRRYPETTEEGRRRAAQWQAYERGISVGALVQQPDVDIEAAVPYVLAMSSSQDARRFMERVATPEARNLVAGVDEQPATANPRLAGIGAGFYEPYWLYYGGFHAGLYAPPPSTYSGANGHSDGGFGGGGGFGGAAGGGGGGGGSF